MKSLSKKGKRSGINDSDFIDERSCDFVFLAAGGLILAIYFNVCAKQCPGFFRDDYLILLHFPPQGLFLPDSFQVRPG